MVKSQAARTGIQVSKLDRIPPMLYPVETKRTMSHQFRQNRSVGEVPVTSRRYMKRNDSLMKRIDAL
jgi:hypothetical protein